MVVKPSGRLGADSESPSPDLAPYAYAGWWRRPSAHDRPAFHWHLVSRALALALWAVPRRHRFSAAALLGRFSTPVVRRTPWYRAQRRNRIDGAGEISLYHALEVLTNSGALFDPALRVEGAEVLDDALRRGRGVLVVSPHARLSQLIFRILYDRGHVPTVVSAAPSAHVYGTRLLIRTIQPSPTFMIPLRSVLRRGGVVCAMVDGKRAAGQRLIEFATAEGQMYISDALIRLALRCEASVVFVSVRLDRRRGVVLTIAGPAASRGLTAAPVANDGAAFIHAHGAAVASAGSA